MPLLFSLVTDRVEMTWSGPHDSHRRLGRCVFIPRREGARLVEGTWRRGIPDGVATHQSLTTGPLLFEETLYSVFLSTRTANSVELRHRDPRLLGGLSAHRDKRTVHGGFSFRGQIGRSRFSVLVGGQPEFDFEVEVSPSKLDYETDYEELTADVQSILRGLVLQYLASTFEEASIEPGGESTELEWALLLRHIVDDLEKALHYIARRPIRGLRRVRDHIRVEKLRRSDSSVRQAVLRGRGRGVLVQLSDSIRARTYLPERRASPTLDTPEHRWLASRLAAARRRLADILSKTRARARAAGSDIPTRLSSALAELVHLEERLNRLLRLEPLQAAQGPPPQGFASLQLQGAPGYREAYYACLSLARGLRLSGGPVELSLKDLHVLYEYWCFLAIVRLVGEVLEQPLPAEQLLSVEQDGLRVRLQQGREQTVSFGAQGAALAVSYSPLFTGKDYLLAQKPDISLTLSRLGWPTVRLVLDAKYRVDSSSDYVRRMGAPGPPQDAINVLHRYRDAILETPSGAPADERGARTVIEGVALFPLSGESTAGFDRSKMWHSLQRLGIGALPFLPSEMEYVRQWLEATLARTGWTTAEKEIPSVSRERLHAWREAAAEPVLIGVLRADVDSHLAWIREHHVYYTPYTPTQPLQFGARYVAFYGGANGPRPSSVWLVARVLSTELRPRAEITTPWTARDPDQLQVVYELGDCEELETPVRNARGERFSSNRWTSRLGLLRATRLEQLYLETEPEWRLYDELALRRIPALVEPGRPSERTADDPRGRAWFRLSERTRAQYGGLAGWILEEPTGNRQLSLQHLVDAAARITANESAGA